MDQKNQNLMTTKQAAAYLGYSPVSLKIMRSKGKGPKFVKLGDTGSVRYRPSDLENYIKEATPESE